MTSHRSFKRLVRARMAKTGESYMAARSSLLAAADPVSSDLPALTMSDTAIERRTGRGWEAWFDILDDGGMSDRSHTEIARWLTATQGIDGWSSQAVTVGYERARGRRAVGERPDGFSISASKTVGVPVERLFDAVVDDAERATWLPDGGLRTRTTIRPRSARFDWDDGTTRVNVGFTPKDDGRSVVTLAHERIADAAEADRMKGFWRERFAVLRAALEG